MSSFPHVQLVDICRPKQWKTISARQLLESGYPVYGANGKIGFYSEFTHETPTLMITCRGATCGNVHISEPRSYINGNAMALDQLDSGRVDIRYLYYFFLRRGFNDVISGSAQPQITGQGLTKVKIPLPPLEEQKHIAAILDKADAIRRKRQQAIDLTDKLLRSVFLDMFGDPVTNPKGWEVKPIESICVQKAGVKAGPFGSALKKEYYTKSGYRIYGQEQVIAGTLSIGDYYIDEAKYSKLASCSVESGDMLVSLVGTLGKTLVVPEKFEPGIINPRLVRLRTNNNLLNSEYLQQLFKQPGFQAQLNAYSHGGTMPILNAGIIKSLNVQLPPIELQLCFISILKSIERKMNNFLSAQALNEDLFSSLTQRAFRGELTKQAEAA